MVSVPQVFMQSLGILYGILTAIAVTVIAVFVQLAEGVSSYALVFSRNFIGFLILLPFAIHERIPLKLELLKKNLFRAAMGLAAIYCYFIALKRLQLVDAVLLSNTVPLFVPFVVWAWLKMNIPKSRILGICLGFVGIVFVLRPGGGFLNWASIVGLGNGFFGAIALVGVRQLTRTISPKVILFYYFVISSVISFFPALFTWERVDSTKIWIYAIGVGVVGFFYQLFLTLSFKYLPASKASSMLYLSVVLSGFASFIIWHKAPDLSSIIGSIFVIAGGIWVLMDKGKPVRRSK